MRSRLCLFLATALVLAAPVSAATLKPWIGFDGGYGKYTMSDPNRVLSEGNTALNSTGLWLWPINGGPAFGVSAGLDLGSGFSAGVGYDRLLASSGTESNLLLYRFRVPANAVRVLGEYALPHKGSLGMHVGVAGGLASVTGIVLNGSAATTVSTYDIRGSAPRIDAYVGGDWYGQPRCRLSGVVGYRHALVDEVKIAGRVAHNPDGSNFTVDYSGLFVGVALKVPIGAVASAPESAAAGRTRPWLGVGGAWGAYAMHDVNADLYRLDSGSDATGGRTSRFGLRPLRSGVTFGASAGLDLPGRMTVGVGYDRLLGSRDGSDAAGSVKERHPANAARAILEYRLRPRGAFEPRLGVSGGVVMEAGSVTLGVTGSPSSTWTLKGSGPLFEFTAGSDWWATARLGLTGALGYRYAKISELRSNDTVKYNPDQTRFVVDYSGLLLRLGLKVR